MRAIWLPAAIAATNVDSASRRKVISRWPPAVVDQQRDVDRLGRARHAQHLPPPAVLADDERVGPEALDRFALVVDGADEQRALAAFCAATP